MTSIANKLNLIEQYLSVRVAEHGVRASNVANAETPNYKSLNPQFEAKLSQKMDGENHLLGSSKDENWDLKLKVSKSRAPAKEDGNNVEMSQEVSAMAENSLLYMTALKILTKEMAIAKYAITNGGR
jgi:flagellar basal-body rod protein FlgB